MSTVEDFKNAPVGATATRSDGYRAMKIDYVEKRWLVQSGLYLNNEEMAEQGFTLDPSAPTTAREALDLTWELAHPVKEGQTIPKGTRYLKKDSFGLKEYIAQVDFAIWHGVVSITRTLEPLPEPKPDWLDAPAVIARHVKQTPDSPPSLWGNLGNGLWGHVDTTKRATVRELRDVTPLYPKETEK